MTTTHIVLSCTNRKRDGGAPYPRLRDVPETPDVRTRAGRWIDALKRGEAHRSARDLYLGEYWLAGLALASTAGRYGAIEAWVISAGVGLVNLDDVIPAYGATFASGHLDSVPARGGSARVVTQAWWAALGGWGGPAGEGRPRLLSDVAATPGARLLVCAGPDYLEAVAADLAAARVRLGDDGLVVVGSGRPIAGLSSSWVQVPGQLRLRFGGSMSSTGVRAARAIVESVAGYFNAHRARELVSSWLAATSPLPRLDRKRLSDTEVEDWILADARHDRGAANKSVALRRLRDEGRACEQSRFSRLYDRVTGGST
jgi:hypothetical protein